MWYGTGNLHRKGNNWRVMLKLVIATGNIGKVKEIEEKLNTDKTTLSEADFNNAKQAADTEFTALRKDLSGKMETEIKTNLEKIAKEKNLSVIIKKNVTVQGGVDVTDEMIAKLQ